MKLRIETLRIVKFILISGTINVAFAFVNSRVISSLSSSVLPSVGTWLSAAGYAYTIITTIIATLLNRYFTFRATEPWYIAVPFMLIATFGWELLCTMPQAAAAKISMTAAMNMSTILNMVWFVVIYLLQRCVIYCHTTDQNGWYRRFHPDTNEEGAYPHE